MFNIFPAKPATNAGDKTRMNPASTISDGEQPRITDAKAAS